MAIALISANADFFIPSTAFAIIIKCERTTNNRVGDKTVATVELWWPKKIKLSGSEFTEAGSGSRAMVWDRQGGEENTRNSFT